MRGSAGEFSKAADAAGQRIYNSPYYKAYMDAARGKSGKVKQIAALGTPIYAYNKLSDLTGMPFRSTEPEKQEDITVKEKDDNLLITEKDKKETVDESTDVNEETLTDDSNVSDGSSNNQSLVEQSNIYAGLIDNDSLRRIEGYKDVIRQFIGTGDEGEQMQKTGLLLQLGSALMAGKSMDPGLKGFMEVVGQAGMQVAPTLFQMGVEKGKAEREIGAAALNLYMNQLDKASDRSGPLTIAYENVYKTDGNNNFVYDGKGDPIPIDRQRVGTYYRKSPEMMNFMDMNAKLGYERFTFVDTTSTKEGIAASGMGTGMETAMESKAGRDAQKKYAKYVQRGLNTMADYIMPLIIEQRDTLTGFWGEVGRIAGPKKALLDSFNQALFSSAGGEEAFNSKFDTIQKDTLSDMEASNYIVYEGANATQVIGGVEVGFYIDKNNKYGFNEGARYSEDGRTLLDPGEAAWIPTRKGIEMLLDNPNRLATKTFETTLGLMLARDRQPTGRMLADVLRRSFREVETASLLDYASNDPRAVIGKYMSIYKELYSNMSDALNMAGVVATEAERAPGLEWAPDLFNVPGAANMANMYYGLRQQDPSYSTMGVDVPGMGIPSFDVWSRGNTGTITQDNVITNQNTQNAFDYWNEKFD